MALHLRSQNINFASDAFKFVDDIGDATLKMRNSFVSIHFFVVISFLTLAFCHDESLFNAASLAIPYNLLLLPIVVALS
jgi:hypothetical protein